MGLVGGYEDSSPFLYPPAQFLHTLIHPEIVSYPKLISHLLLHLTNYCPLYLSPLFSRI